MKLTKSITRFFTTILIGGFLVGLCCAALLPGYGVLAAAHSGDDRIDIALSSLKSRTIVFDSAENEIGRIGLEDRDPVKLSQVPEIMKKAVVAVEDQTFWDNPGIDAKAILRAASSNVEAGGNSQGGSTITQQLVKNRVLTDEKTYSRKLKEAVIAYRITQIYSKTEILQEYLNTVYFGQGSYGIKSASERFFGKPLKDLKLSEAALLAGAIQNPEYRNPFLYPDRARERRKQVLEIMREQKIITKEQADKANAEAIPTNRPSAELKPDNYLVAEAQRLLLEDTRLGSTPQERYNKVLSGGLKVYTSFNPELQSIAKSAVDTILPNQQPFTAAMVVMERSTGKVVAMVGGPGFADSKYNLVTQGERQPGSTYKAITLATALENGYSPNDKVSGVSPCNIKVKGQAPWKTANAERGGGIMTLRSATVGSVNCAFAHVIASLGPEKVASMAKRLGVTHTVPNYLSITLGTDETTPLDMTTVFNTLANSGVRHDPIFITKVVGPSGEVIFQEKYNGTKVLDPQLANTVTDMLRGVVTSGTGTGARLNGFDAFGKTGTTENYGDAWFCGGTVKYTSCVWMGDPKARTPMKRVGGRTVFGGTYPASIWKQFMTGALAGETNVMFPAPDKNLWPSSKYISDLGRGKGSPPITTTTLPPDPNLTVPSDEPPVPEVPPIPTASTP
ncbi:MAG: transglycosylase domain-containing protein [Acidimicrobiia bacterium]|nr:transglycosylase domain-containing protein [Acidimicrobiia bacterium]